MATKVCTKCGQEKELSEFHLCKTGIKGRTSHCKECKSTLTPEKKAQKKIKEELALRGLKVCSICGQEKTTNIKGWSGSVCPSCHNLGSREYYSEHKDERRLYDKKRNEKRKEYLKKKNKDYYNKNKVKHREINKQWRNNNPEKSDAIYARYRKTEKRRKINREWAVNNREKSYKYRNDKYKNNTQYNLNIKIRRRIFQAIKQRRVTKSDRTIQLLGCSMHFFDEYIKSLFYDGMTFEDLLSGKIHIDHIIPVAAFDLTNDIHQLACFNWRNLQPMFKIPNIQKGTKYKQEDFDNYMDWFIKNLINK